MQSYEFHQRFEKIISEYFKQQGYQVSRNYGLRTKHGAFEIDLILEKQITTYVELRFYRSVNVHAGLIRDVARNFAYKLDQDDRYKAILIVNVALSPQLVVEIIKDTGLEVWDRNVLLDKLNESSSELKESFELLVLEAQPGTDTTTFTMASGTAVNDAIKQTNFARPVKSKISPPKIGKGLISELKALECGHGKWNDFESLATKILQFLFDKDLTLWDHQPRTDDELSRFDLICRINPFDDFWKSIVSAFNSRFILFEFKNYNEPIGQNQIYTTERYLYRNALRSVGIIFARKGGNAGAIQAAKGALREHGKLILILSDQDLEAMLEMKDTGSSPNDYLANQLDKWLIELSR